MDGAGRDDGNAIHLQIMKFFAAKIGRHIERTFAINFGHDMDCLPRLEAPTGSIVELGDINK